MFDINAAKNNMRDDLKHANGKELVKIHDDLIKLLNKYDQDKLLKEIGDRIKIFFTIDLRNKCKKRFDDLIEEYDKIKDPVKKNEFEKDIVNLVNIHKNVLEKLGNLFRGL